MTDMDKLLEVAFKAGYHCQWIKVEQRWIFDPAMKPGDPNGAYAAWKAACSGALLDLVVGDKR